MIDKINSPVTNTPNVRCIKTIPKALIVKKYQNELNIDVSRFFENDDVNIYECLDTGYKFYYPFNIEGDGKLYEDLQKKNAYYSNWNWEHQMAFRYINRSDKVLEIGCGTGGFLLKLSESKIDTYGLELNKKAVEACKEKKLNVYNELLENHKNSNFNKYDVVCSFQVLEHISNVKNYISDCINVTKMGGKIIFGVPNNEPFVYKRDIFHTLNLPPHHMGLWSENSFKQLENFFDIKLVDVQVQKLNEVREYLQVFFQYNKLALLNKVSAKFPLALIKVIAEARKWKGRNLIGIFEKK